MIVFLLILTTDEVIKNIFNQQKYVDSQKAKPGINILEGVGKKFEEIIAAKDKKNNTKKKDIIVSEGLKFPIPQTFNDMKLIEDGKLAQTFLQQWLNSPSPVEGQTMGEYVKSNNLLLTYTDTEGEQKIIKISKK